MGQLRGGLQAAGRHPLDLVFNQLHAERSLSWQHAVYQRKSQKSAQWFSAETPVSATPMPRHLLLRERAPQGLDDMLGLSLAHDNAAGLHPHQQQGEGLDPHVRAPHDLSKGGIKEIKDVQVRSYDHAMSAETREDLEAFFRPHNARLHELLSPLGVEISWAKQAYLEMQR